jgi:hypothetical protein
MKKTAAIIGILSFLAIGTFAQHNERNNRYKGEANDRYAFGKFKKKGRFDDNWGYDHDYNRVSGNKAIMIDSYQRRAKVRINIGIRNGQITRQEANKLMRFYVNIERKENRFMRNGRISRAEARELDRDLDQLNRMITRETRDLEKRRF